MRPHDGAADAYRNRGNGTDDWQPSRVRSIEELPIALALLTVTGGDFEQSICGGANYGRDCDSIASMAGAIAGALHGDSVIRPAWITRIDEANRVDLGAVARDLMQVTIGLQQRESVEATLRSAAFARLSATDAGTIAPRARHDLPDGRGQ